MSASLGTHPPFGAPWGMHRRMATRSLNATYGIPTPGDVDFARLDASRALAAVSAASPISDVQMYSVRRSSPPSMHANAGLTGRDLFEHLAAFRAPAGTVG